MGCDRLRQAMPLQKAALVLLFGLSSCGDGGSEARNQSSTEVVRSSVDAPISGTSAATPPPPPPHKVGDLRPLDQKHIARELASGAGCAIDDDQRGPLLVAVAGDAVVNDGGKIVHLQPLARDLEGLALGGLFAGGGLRVEIKREHRIEQVDEVTSWQATLRVTRGDRGFTSYHHRWSCGA
jgi:hypothetical protein